MLVRFSIGLDSRHRIPALRQTLAIKSLLTSMASPWSLPGWMKRTGRLIKGTLLSQYHDAFANYFVLDAKRAWK